MFRHFILIIVLSFPSTLHACLCAEFRTLKENIALYPVIAHIRIEKTFLTDDSAYVDGAKVFYKKVRHELKIIELFKGSQIKTLIEYDGNSSCEIGMKEGEEWILFAELDTTSNSYFVAACNPSRHFTNARGNKSWKLQRKILKELRRSR